MQRRLERRLLVAAAIWTGLLALVTLFPYRMWFEQAAAGSAADSLIAGASAVVGVYGLIMLLVALVTGWLAWRIGTRPGAAVLWWTGACALEALLTRDVVGCLLFSVTCAVAAARTRALRKVNSIHRTQGIHR